MYDPLDFAELRRINRKHPLKIDHAGLRLCAKRFAIDRFCFQSLAQLINLFRRALNALGSQICGPSGFIGQNGDERLLGNDFRSSNVFSLNAHLAFNNPLHNKGLHSTLPQPGITTALNLNSHCEQLLHQ
jgi:hypothetical protein